MPPGVPDCGFCRIATALDESCHPDRPFKKVMEPVLLIFVFIIHILLEEIIFILFSYFTGGAR